MAAALLAHHLDRLGVDATVHSAGTLAWTGSRASPDAVAVLAERGIDINQHEARGLTPEMIEAADVIIGMTRDHVDAVLNRAPAARPRTFVVGELARGIDAHRRRAADEVADPFGDDLEVYRRTRERLDKMMALVAMRLRSGRAPVREAGR